MRTALIGGLAGLLLVGCSSVPVPMNKPVIAPVPACTAPTDPELIVCAAQAPILTIDTTIEYGPELAVPTPEREAALRLAREYLLRGGLRLRIAHEAQPTQDVNDPIRISFLSDEMYTRYRSNYGGNGGGIGCANLLTRTVHLNTGKIDALLHDACPAQRAAIVAATLVHEIGHLFGLIHVDAMAPYTSMPVNDYLLRPNVMLSDELPAQRSAFDPRLCASDLDALIPSDLPIAMEPIQRAQMRSAATSGRIWGLMRTSGFDYEIYENAYRDAILPDGR